MINIRKAFFEGALSKPAYIRTMYEEHHTNLYAYSEFLKYGNVSAIEITDGLVVMTARDSGIKIICPPGDYRVAPVEILNFGQYEIKDSRMIMHLVGPNSCMLDIGANMGWYALHLSKSQPTTVIHAFEPLPNTYAALVANVGINRVDNVVTHNFGFSNEKKELRFFFYPEGSGNASQMNLTERSDAQEIVCQVDILDNATKLLKLPRVDFIKCDVEGAELFVFEGGKNLLAKDKPIVFAEMLRKWAAKFNYHPNAIIALFKDLGYRCFSADLEGKLHEFFDMDETTVETNFFFMHKQQHDATIARLLTK